MMGGVFGVVREGLVYQLETMPGCGGANRR